MSKFQKLIDRFDGWKVLDGKLLQKLRVPTPQKKIALKTVSKVLKKSVGQISQYENETSLPSLETFKKICLYYQIDANVLLGLRWVDED